MVGLLLRFFNYGNQTPTFLLGKWARFHYAHSVAYTTLISFVMGFQFIGAFHNFSDYGVLNAIFHGHYDGFIHFIAYDPAYSRLAQIT
jgi:hypothetical protein